jgi:hypothetical protein
MCYDTLHVCGWLCWLHGHSTPAHAVGALMAECTAGAVEERLHADMHTQACCCLLCAAGVALKEVGLATHFIASHLVPELPARLQALGPQLQDLSQVGALGWPACGAGWGCWSSMHGVQLQCMLFCGC